MKLITAIIQPHGLDQVREALGELDVHGMTVTEVRGYGRQKGHTEMYRGAEYTIAYRPKIKIEIGVEDSRLEAVVDTIASAARSGKIGDGKIFVIELLSATRVRTGETGDTAL